MFLSALLNILTAKFLKKQDMIIIPIKEKESVERALKRFKRKFERTGVIKELRERQAFKKPSVRKRENSINAIYKQKLRQLEENE